MIVAILFLLVFPMILSSCGGASFEKITLNLQLGSGIGTGSPSYDETNSMVIRCASFAENGNQLNAQASKLMSLKADTLIFVENPVIEVPTGGVQIVVVPVTGKENEYDIAQARFYIVTKTTAEEIRNDYGIEYATWYSGAASGAEKFDCCK
jgi:hypothetical protein